MQLSISLALGSQMGEPIGLFLNSYAFHAPLKSTLVLAAGSGSPTFTRATVATVVDFEGVVKSAKSGEARFTGARRVENLFLGSSVDISNGSWQKGNGGTGSIAVATANYAVAPDGTTTASRVVLDKGAGSASTDFSRIFQYIDPGPHTSRKSIWLKSNSGSSFVIEIGNTGATNVTVTTAWQRFAVPVEVSGDGYFFIYNRGNTPGGVAVADLLVWGAMYERVTGQANQNPSEYVSVGVLSTPYHGASVDGVKYFETENGNTVASNVVTEATGAAIADAALHGYRPEDTRTNRCLYSQDFSNAAWVATNVTKASNEAVAPDGTTTADTLTATSANGTVIQDLGVVASAAKTGALWIKRKTGTGNVDLTMDGGTGWTTVAVTSSWTRFQKSQTVADEDFGIRIVTSGDAVWVWQGQVETGAFASSDIVTTSAAVARNADLESWPTASNFSDTAGTLYFEAESASWANASGRIVGDAAEGILASASNSGVQGYDGTNTVNGSAGSPSGQIKVAVAWSGSTMRICVNGGTVATGTYDGAWNLSAIFAGHGFFGNVRNIKLWQKAAEDAALIRATA